MEKPGRFRGMNNRISEALDMPKEIYTKEPKMIIMGFKKIIIENYKGIQEYEENFLKIETYLGNINISGIDLNLAKMTEDSLDITGKITSINTEFN